MAIFTRQMWTQMVVYSYSQWMPSSLQMRGIKKSPPPQKDIAAAATDWQKFSQHVCSIQLPIVQQVWLHTAQNLDGPCWTGMKFDPTMPSFIDPSVNSYNTVVTKVQEKYRSKYSIYSYYPSFPTLSNGYCFNVPKMCSTQTMVHFQQTSFKKQKCQN